MEVLCGMAEQPHDEEASGAFGYSAEETGSSGGLSRKIVFDIFSSMGLRGDEAGLVREVFELSEAGYRKDGGAKKLILQQRKAVIDEYFRSAVIHGQCEGLAGEFAAAGQDFPPDELGSLCKDDPIAAFKNGAGVGNGGMG